MMMRQHHNASDEIAVYDGDFNDGADFDIVDDERKTNN
jgi:hypothetical protein